MDHLFTGLGDGKTLAQLAAECRAQNLALGHPDAAEYSGFTDMARVAARVSAEFARTDQYLVGTALGGLRMLPGGYHPQDVAGEAPQP